MLLAHIRPGRRVLLVSLALLTALACDKSQPESEPPQPIVNQPEPMPIDPPDEYALIAPNVDVASLRAKVDQFAPVVLQADTSHLPEAELLALAKPGAGFYPPGLDTDWFQGYLDASRPESVDALTSSFTVVQRDSDDPVRLIAAFRTDDYYQSDKDWMDLDSAVEITIGPYETYEDELRGLKASFEAFVTVADPEASKKLAIYKDWLPKMEQNLPVPKAVKTKRGAESPIRVVDLVYTSGDARKSVQTIAFNLPNDVRVRAEKGAKKVMLRNAIDAKFSTIMLPIAGRVLVAEQLPLVSQQAFFDEVLFHELSHSLGPAMTKTADGRELEIRVALGANYSPLEEGKADVMGVWNLLFMMGKQNQLFPKGYRDQVLVTYFAGLFRSVRFGVAEASASFHVDTAKLAKAVETLTHDVVMLQHEGDVAKVEAFLAEYGVMSPPMQAALAKLDGIPVDIRPSYPGWR